MHELAGDDPNLLSARYSCWVLEGGRQNKMPLWSVLLWVGEWEWHLNDSGFSSDMMKFQDFCWTGKKPDNLVPKPQFCVVLKILQGCLQSCTRRKKNLVKLSEFTWLRILLITHQSSPTKMFACMLKFSGSKVSRKTLFGPFKLGATSVHLWLNYHQ